MKAKAEMVFFNRSIFNHAVLLAFPSVDKFVSFKICDVVILYFHIFQGSFQVFLKSQYLNLLCMSLLLAPLCFTLRTVVRKLF